jgi:hypothetical protein
MRPLFRLFLLVLALAPAAPAAAQRLLPPPVDLGIRNIMQETDVWCWAAVAQQVITSRKGTSPPQCALVAMVHGRYPSYCCPHYERCAVPGSLHQIQTLIRNFGQRTSALAAPSSATSLYRTLKAGHPIILAIRGSRTGHAIVLTGMSWTNGRRGPEAVLHVNDPLRVIPSRHPYRT